MPREFLDPYTYAGTNVLKNKPGFRDDAVLSCFEYEQSKFRLEELRDHPIAGRFDIDHFKAVHKHLFQDVYEWAGETRRLNIRKGGSSFAQVAFIEGSIDSVSKSLASENALQGLGRSQFVDRLSHYYAEWNAVHPFREGNGRTTRILVEQLAREAGFHFDRDKIDNDKGQWNEAARQSMSGNLEPVRQIFSEAVRFDRAVAFERLPEAEALALHPDLKGSFDGLRYMQDHYAGRFPGDAQVQAQYLAHCRADILRRLDAGAVLGINPQRDLYSPERATPPQPTRVDRGPER